MITLTINGRKIEAEPGSSVLAAAQVHDIWIPALCHHAALSDYGACRLCLVEVAGRDGRRRLAASCTLPVAADQQIFTDSKRLESLRRIVMELILAACPHSPAVQALAARLGARPGRLTGDPENDCLLCGRCVRACREISRAEAISFSGRGVERRVTTPFGEASARCILCGACVFVCPTGSRLLDLAKISGCEPRALRSRFDAGLAGEAAIARPFPQAVPNAPAINPRACLRLNREACGRCEQVCAAQAINYRDRDRVRTLRVGAVIAAPGFAPFVPDHDAALGYADPARPPGPGGRTDVVTGLEFERLLSASGPTGGHLRRPSDGQPPRRIAFLQCVGSRDLSCRGGYCSAVCCMYAIKEAVVAREHDPGVQAVIFALELRTFGKDFDRFAERARSEYGVVFRYARAAQVARDPRRGGCEVVFTDESGRIRREQFDLVVLAVGLRPPAGLGPLARMLGARLNEFGFLWTDPLLAVASSRPGIFAAGAAAGPRDIPETVIQAGAAACQAARLLAPARHTLATARRYPPERNVAGEPARIGVFVCHCGINIGGVVDVPAVRDYAAALPGVAHAEHNLYTCSQDAQKLIRQRIAEYRLNRVVVASCSPRTHEALFQETLREAGLNPHLFVMANIRDQCSWVHQRAPAAATAKARDLVRLAVATARLAEPLPPVVLPVTPAALVIGGGLSGLTAALAIADQGFEVCLVEQEAELGGNLRQLQRTLAGYDLQALLRNAVARALRHPRLRVRRACRVAEVKGFVGNYETTLTDGTVCKHGAVLVATGAREYQPAEYDCGRRHQVMTQLALARRLEDPPADPPRSVVMIQCVGSREEPRPYCSRVCCAKALQNALRLKELFPAVRVHILYRDLRAYGFREQFYAAARDRGVLFTRFDLAARPAVRWRGAEAIVTVPDPLLGRPLELAADWLVLSAGMVADTAANDALAKQLKVPLNSDGFFLEAHVKLRPVEFATDGVFLAGLAHGPKFAEEAVSQALAAASRAAALLARREIEAPGAISAVNTELCAACGLCEQVCPFGAAALETQRLGGRERRAAKINPALCKGCGLCAAGCRGGAIVVRGGTDEQVLAAIAALAAD